jgi:hypothetical protein
MLGYGAFMFVFALVLQQGLHADPLAARLAPMRMAVPFLITSLYLPRLVSRLGAQNVTALGGADLAAGLVGPIAANWLSWLHVALHAMARAAQSSAPGRRWCSERCFGSSSQRYPGTGSGVRVTVQQAGLAVGVATLGTLYTGLSSRGTAGAFTRTTGIQVLIAAAIRTGAHRMPSPLP